MLVGDGGLLGGRRGDLEVGVEGQQVVEMEVPLEMLAEHHPGGGTAVSNARGAINPSKHGTGWED